MATGRRILIAGGGVAALEAVLALREWLPDVARIEVLTASPDFVYRPVSVAEPFDRGEARHFPWSDIAADRSIHVRLGELARVDVDGNLAETRDGDRIPYDVLLIATGARAVDPLPGALTFAGGQSVAAMRDLLDELERGEVRTVAFTTPSASSWPLPLYELALMTAAFLAGREITGRRLIVVTPEEEPLALFGPAGVDAVAPLLAMRGVELRTASRPQAVSPEGLELTGGQRVHCDRVVTLPALEGPRIAGLAYDSLGFIPTDANGLVTGTADVYAAGDATAFPLKQGGLAAQQADAAAAAIARRLGAAIEPEPFTGVLRGLLLTGTAPRYLRAEPDITRAPGNIAIDAPPPRIGRAPASDLSTQPLWWPPAKIAGRFLAPYLATARPVPLSRGALHDRPAPAGDGESEGERADALELALLIADYDAHWSDYRQALRALDSAEAIAGVLPPEYEHKRAQWRAALS
jgi:sulfide:quinone oxidoreductase